MIQQKLLNNVVQFAIRQKPLNNIAQLVLRIKADEQYNPICYSAKSVNKVAEIEFPTVVINN